MLKMIKKALVVFLIIVVGLPFFATESFNYLLEKGIDEYNKGQYDFAISNLNRYVQLAQESREKAKAYFYLGLAYYFKRSYDFALNSLNILSSRYRYSDYTVQSYFWIALIYQNIDKLKEAERFFIKFIENAQKSALIDKAYLALGNTQIELGKYKDAEKNLKIIIDKYIESSKYEEASTLYAYLLIKQGKNDESKIFLDSWMERLKDDGGSYVYKDRFWFYRAEVAFNSNDFITAEKYYKKVDIYAKDSSIIDIVLFRLSQIEEQKGQSSNAERYISRLLTEKPDSKYAIEASFNMAVKYITNGYLDRAFTVLENIKNTTDKLLKEKIDKAEAKKAKTLYFNATFYLADIYYKKGDYKNSILLMQNVADSGESIGKSAMLKLIEYSINVANYNEAKGLIDKYSKELSQDEKTVSNFFLLKSNFEYLTGDYLNSLKSLDKVTVREDNKADFYDLRYKNLTKLQRFDEAITVLKEAISFNPERGVFLKLNLVNLYFNTGEFEKAITEANSINILLSNISEKEKREIKIKLDFHLGLSYMMIKDYKKGSGILENLISENRNRSLDKELSGMILLSYYYLGWINYKMGEINRAIFYFEQSKRLDIPEQFVIDSYFMNAWCYFYKGDYSKARDLFEEIYKKFYPKDIAFKAYFYAGKSLYNIKEKERAIKIFNEIYRTLPENSYRESALSEIILDKLESKKIEEANSLLKEFELKFPKSELYSMLLLKEADTLLDLERYSESYSIYQYLINSSLIKENKDTIYYWFSFSAYKIRDYNTAEKYLNLIIDEIKGSSFYNEAINLLYKIYLEQKNYKNLELILIEAIKLETDKKRIDEYKETIDAISLIKNGKEDREAFLLVKARTDINAKYELAKYYKDTDNLSLSMNLLQDIIDKDKSSTGAKALLLYADISIKMDDYKKALSLIIQFLDRGRDVAYLYPEALYKMAFCYYKIDERENFSKVINRLKSNYQSSEWTEKAKELERIYR